ncbi:cytochrome b/b6 domain-containing protein [Rhodopseudomonas palustris]|nr:cytochrome b/b6 domain-containing protein [Rhodopseudomonas palustris]
MSILNQSIEAGGATPPAEVKVWDSFVRLFHWSLAGLFVLAYATGDEIEKVHIAAGYTIAALLAARVLWGFIGPHHARFVNFVRPPGEMLANLRDAVRLRAPRYLGHNPAGAAMIISLILMISSTCVTGYLLTGAFWGSKLVEKVHETLANATVALIALHILGVIVVSFEHKENLVKAMITGMKRKLD